MDGIGNPIPPSIVAAEKETRMFEQAYRYRFAERVDMRGAEDLVFLSILAADGLFGEARVRMDAAYAVDESIRALVIDAGTPVGLVVNCIFTAFALREFGPCAIHVRRVEAFGPLGEVR